MNIDNLLEKRVSL